MSTTTTITPQTNDNPPDQVDNQEEQKEEQKEEPCKRNIMKTTKTTYKRQMPKKVKGKTVIDPKTSKPVMVPSKPAFEIHHRCDDENSDVSDAYRKLLFRFVLGHNGSNVEGLYRMAKRHFGRKLNVWKNRPDIFIIDKEGKEVILRESEKSHVIIISSLDKDLTSYLSEQVVKDIKYIKGIKGAKTSRPLSLVKCPGKYISQLIDLIPTILKKEKNPDKLSLHYEKMLDKTSPKPKPKPSSDPSKESKEDEEPEEEKMARVVGTFVISGDDSMTVMRTKLNVESTIQRLKDEEEKKKQKAKKKSLKTRSNSDSSDSDSSDLDSSDSDSSSY